MKDYINMELKQGFIVETPEGLKVFATKAEATDYMRRPKVLEALAPLVGEQADLANWLIENQEGVESAFETGTIRRVSKSEKNQLQKAAEFIRDYAHGNPEKKIEAHPDFAKGAKFIVDNIDAVVEVFRWPTVKRMSEEDKAAAIRQALIELAGDEALADWIIATREQITAAYGAGIEKRAVDPKASEGLKAYRVKKAREKLEAAREAGDAEKIAAAEAALAKAEAS